MSDHRPVGIQLDFNALQISNPSDIQFLHLQPNPSGIFNMEFYKASVSHLIEIFDTKGRLVHKATVSNSGVLSFNLSLNKGVYLVESERKLRFTN